MVSPEDMSSAQSWVEEIPLGIRIKTLKILGIHANGFSVQYDKGNC